MAQENERKYLIQSETWRKQAHGGEHYRQGYLSTDPERSVRVRAGSKKAFLTIKGKNSGGNGLNRAEFKYPIPLDEANQLLDHLCRQPLIEKTRFRLPQNGHVWEIDQFEKQNQGLVLAEVELHAGHKLNHLPKWVGEEVSGDDRYSNVNLVEHPYAEWRGESGKPDPKYHWKADESVSQGLQRIVREELELAIWQLSENAAATDEAVHEARKCLKKIRSAMRLLQIGIGPVYEKENGVLRGAGRKLSPVRDSQALIEIFDELKGKYREKLGDRSLVPIRDGLVAHKKQLDADFERKRLRGKVLKTLRESADRVDKWNLNGADAAAITQGFARTIRRNRKAYANAYSDSDPLAFHEWRKRAKDLRYHLNLLSKAWPPVLDGYEEAAKDLEQKLGDDHNLVVLRDTILEEPHDFGKEADISAFLKIVDDRQKKLRSDSKTLAERLYSEKPRYWRKRIQSCWAAWKEDQT